MNKRRKAIWDKSGGHCWYCGTQLPEKGWHEDHFEPVYRETVYAKENGRAVAKPTGNMLKAGRDTEDNKVPSCAPCNLFKSVFSVEEFRQEIQMQVERARKSSVNFRTAERFGLIKTNDDPVVFWFEANGEINA